MDLVNALPGSATVMKEADQLPTYVPHACAPIQLTPSNSTIASDPIQCVAPLNHYSINNINLILNILY